MAASAPGRTVAGAHTVLGGISQQMHSQDLADRPVGWHTTSRSLIPARMWRVGIADLINRRRRFALAVLATSLAFGLSLLMSGTLAHLTNETNRIIALFQADRFVVAEGGTGPFTTTRLLPASTAAELAREPGVTRADPFVQARETLKGKDVNILGIVPGGLGSPAVHSGRLPQASGEALADSTLGYHVGDHFSLGSLQLTVVGTTTRTTYYFGQPTVFLPIGDVQKSFLAGQPYATAVAVRGTLANAPAGTKVLDRAGVRTDLNRPQKSGTQTVAIFNSLLWIMAAGIVATMVYLTALERARDIAVFKSMGAANHVLFAGMAVQGLALALAACAVGAVISLLLGPLMPFAVETPASAYVQVIVVGIVVGLIAALSGLRRAVHIDPALAFGRQA
jgi:putative ABC transport system permease protein